MAAAIATTASALAASAAALAAAAASGRPAGLTAAADAPSTSKPAGSDSLGQVLRSKGYVWLATRNDLCGVWGQAGRILSLAVGGPWFASLPKETLDGMLADPAKKAEVARDFQGAFGDRRQELVLVGIGLRRAELRSALDACLLTETEMKGGAVAWSRMVDPFREWPPLEALLNDDEDDGDSMTEEEEEEEEDLGSGTDVESFEEDEDEEIDAAFSMMQLGQQQQQQRSAVAAKPQASTGLGGRLHQVSQGAAGLQSLLDGASGESFSLAVVDWFAPWAAPCSLAAGMFAKLAQEHPDILFARLDVAAGEANSHAAMELVLTHPVAKRENAKPQPKMGGKFPCFTLHYPPSIGIARTFAGETAFADLARFVRSQSSPVVADVAALGAVEAPQPPTVAAPQKAAGTAKPAPSKRITVRTITEGAAEFRAVLHEAKESGMLACVCWDNTEAEPKAGPPQGGLMGLTMSKKAGVMSFCLDPSCRDANCRPGPATAAAGPERASALFRSVVAENPNFVAPLAPRLMLLELDVSASAKNGVLAQGLKIKMTPCIQIYR